MEIKVMLKKFSVTLMLIFVICNISCAQQPKQSAMPQQFRTSIGGFFGPSYIVELRDGSLIYSARKRGESEAKTTIITPSAAQWLAFSQALDDIKVWQWQTKYMLANSHDGTQWSLDISYANRAIKTHGHNLYPDDNNGSKEEPSQAFKRYLTAVMRLINGNDFK
jgi:hypothetical protein